MIRAPKLADEKITTTPISMTVVSVRFCSDEFSSRPRRRDRRTARTRNELRTKRARERDAGHEHRVEPGMIELEKDAVLADVRQVDTDHGRRAGLRQERAVDDHRSILEELGQVEGDAGDDDGDYDATGFRHRAVAFGAERVTDHDVSVDGERDCQPGRGDLKRERGRMQVGEQIRVIDGQRGTLPRRLVVGRILGVLAEQDEGAEDEEEIADGQRGEIAIRRTVGHGFPREHDHGHEVTEQAEDGYDDPGHPVQTERQELEGVSVVVHSDVALHEGGQGVGGEFVHFRHERLSE